MTTEPSDTPGDNLSLCWGCKKIRVIAVVDGASRDYCRDCASLMPESREAALLSFLALTVPYKEGDKVSCKTGGQVYDGVGHVVRVSFDPEDLASPVVPMFLVALDDKAYPEAPDEVWYSEVCMERVEG